MFSALTQFDSCSGAGAPSPPAFMRGVVRVAHTGTGGSSYKRLRSNLCVIPNQSEDWCGNPPRHCDRFLLKMEIATPVCALARNDREFGLAMTGNSYFPRPCASAGTPPSQVRGARRLSTRTPFGAGALNDHLSDVSRTRRNRSFFYYHPIRLIRQVRRSFK